MAIVGPDSSHIGESIIWQKHYRSLKGAVPEIFCSNHRSDVLISPRATPFASNALPPEEQSIMREKVERLDDFQWCNNPHGERDFGAFARNGRKFFCKVDYRAPEAMHGSEVQPEADDAHPDHHVGFQIAATWKTVTQVASFFCNNCDWILYFCVYTIKLCSMSWMNEAP